jgi:hypothetical protein
VAPLPNFLPAQFAQIKTLKEMAKQQHFVEYESPDARGDHHQETSVVSGQPSSIGPLLDSRLRNPGPRRPGTSRCLGNSEDGKDRPGRKTTLSSERYLRLVEILLR